MGIGGATNLGLGREERDQANRADDRVMSCKSSSMGLAPGGRMKQKIYEDPYGISDWDVTVSSRCFINITNSLVWRSITGPTAYG